MDTERAWTNASVLRFADGVDPLTRAHAVAAELQERARREGLSGPPVDVLSLAERLGVALRPRNDLADARILAEEAGLVIEYNPSRPRGRLRFSVAHEIAHAQFADVADRPRHRTAGGSLVDPRNDDWELELLCDVIAADLLIPERAVEGLLTIDPDLDFIMQVRRRWDVSTEALLRRLVTATPRQLTLLAASRPEGATSGSMRVDYVVRSLSTISAGLTGLEHGDRIDDPGPLAACTGVGQVERGLLSLAGTDVSVQAVGVPGFAGSLFPRVLALMEPPAENDARSDLRFVHSDVLEFERSGPVLIVQVVSTDSHRWGFRGVGGTLSRAFPDFAQAFRYWSIAAPDNLTLGNVHFVERQVDGQLIGVASVVAQDGFGSSEALLDHSALSAGLTMVQRLASTRGAAVHVPRLGVGQAGGRWDLVEQALVAQLSQRGVPVTVHTPPAADRRARA